MIYSDQSLISMQIYLIFYKWFSNHNQRMIFKKSIKKTLLDRRNEKKVSRRNERGKESAKIQWKKRSAKRIEKEEKEGRGKLFKYFCPHFPIAITHQQKPHFIHHLTFPLQD